MHTADIVIAACTVITTLIAMKFWLMSGIEDKLKKIDERFEKIDVRFDKLDDKLEKMEDKLDTLDRRVSVIEGYLMGRDFRNTGSGK